MQKKRSIFTYNLKFSVWKLGGIEGEETVAGPYQPYLTHNKRQTSSVIQAITMFMICFQAIQT